MLELWGSTAAVRYADGRVVVSPLSAEDDKSLDAARGDLHRVMLGLIDEGEGVTAARACPPAGAGRACIIQQS